MIKIYVLFLLYYFLCSTTAYSQRAAKNYLAENKYLEGIEVLEKQLDTASQPKKIEIYEQLMRLYFAYAELTEKVWSAASKTGRLYFNIMEEKNNTFTPTHIYYRGLYAFEAGYYREAEHYFTLYIQDKRAVPSFRNYAAIWLGGSQYMLGKTELAVATWSGVSIESELNRSELAYVTLRIGAEVYISNTSTTISSKSKLTNRSIRNIIQNYLSEGNLIHVRDLVHQIDFVKPANILNEGEDNEIRFYDPSFLKTAALAYYGLSAWYAELLDTHIAGKDKIRILTPFYRGIYFYKMGRYQDAIDVLGAVTQTGEEHTQVAALYLAASYYLMDRHKTAEIIFSYLENYGSDEIRSKLGLLYYILGNETKFEIGKRLAIQSMENAKSRYGRRISQIFHRNLGEIMRIRSEYNTAYEIFNEGYRSEASDDIRANAPIYNVGYSEVIVLGRNFNSLTVVFMRLREVTAYYDVATALDEIIVYIDALTILGSQGEGDFRKY